MESMRPRDAAAWSRSSETNSLSHVQEGEWKAIQETRHGSRGSKLDSTQQNRYEPVEVGVPPESMGTALLSLPVGCSPLGGGETSGCTGLTCLGVTGVTCT